MSENITYSTEKIVVNFEVSPHELNRIKAVLINITSTRNSRSVDKAK
jgi:hypothetical protein